MKLGILGTGMIIKDLMTTYQKLHIEKTYLLGTLETKEETEQLCQKYHLDQTFYDYDELLKSDVDTIYIALPNHLHYSFAKKAITHQKHVIIEKPICANTQELQDLITLSQQYHVIVLEAMNIHYLPAYQSLQKTLSKIGQIKILNFNYSQYSSRYNAFKQGQILPAFDYHKAGGALMDLNVYNLHAIIGLFGKPVDNHYYANIEKGIDTSGIMVLEYPHFQAISIGAKDCKAPITSTIQGDLGAIVMNTPINQLTEYTLIDNNGLSTKYEFSKDEHRLYYEFQAFQRIIDEKDFDKAQNMLKLSLDVASVMEKGRKQEGVVFDNDQQ